MYLFDFGRKQKGGIIFGKEEFEPFTYDTMSLYICKSCRKGVADDLTEAWGN